MLVDTQMKSTPKKLLVAEQAKKMKTGTLNLQELKRKGLQIPDSIKRCPLVSVSFLTMAWNQTKNETEPVFQVADLSGTVYGTYYATAFLSLNE